MQSDPLRTFDAELSQYVTLYRGDGSCFPIHKDDAAQIATAEPGHIPLRSIDGFIVTAVKANDGSVYLPNCAYRGEEQREAVTVNEWLDARHVHSPSSTLAANEKGHAPTT